MTQPLMVVPVATASMIAPRSMNTASCKANATVSNKTRVFNAIFTPYTKLWDGIHDDPAIDCGACCHRQHDGAQKQSAATCKLIWIQVAILSHLQNAWLLEAFLSGLNWPCTGDSTCWTKHYREAVLSAGLMFVVGMMPAVDCSQDYQETSCLLSVFCLFLTWSRMKLMHHLDDTTSSANTVSNEAHKNLGPNT